MPYPESDIIQNPLLNEEPVASGSVNKSNDTFIISIILL